MSHSFYLPFFYLVLNYVHIICNRLRRTPKSFSHRFLGSNTRFVSIMVTNPKNAILRFVFSKLPRVKGKMDISWDNQKCPKNGGIITLRRIWPSADLNENIRILNEIFSAEKCYILIFQFLRTRRIYNK